MIGFSPLGFSARNGFEHAVALHADQISETPTNAVGPERCVIRGG
jgi:hypothetical protein